MDDQTRQEYVRAAISFLQNPKLVDSTLQDKLRFLKDKGLSQVEVDEALNLALINRHQSQGGKWNYLLVLGLCIGGYRLYQAYLESQNKMAETPSTSGQTSKSRSLQTNKSNIFGAQINQDGKDNLSLSDILQKMNELKRLVELQRTNFQTEIQSIKTLLLGHEKFAAPPVIPAWQLKDSDAKSVAEGSAVEGT